MAANSLFSCFRGNKFSYTPTGRSLPAKKTVDLVRYTCNNSMDNQPAKKRKMDEDDEDWDDDDFQLTQKELESIDVMASQSVSNATTAPYRSNPGPSGAALPSAGGSMQRSDSGRQSGQTKYSFVRPKPVSLTGNNSSVSSSDSPHPYSNSTSGSRRSTSSTSSEEIPLAPQSLSRRNSSSMSADPNDQSLTAMYLRNPIVEAEIEKFKKQCQHLENQLKSAKEDTYSNEGRLKILQDNFNKKEAELNELRQERAKQIDQHKREQTEKERNLQSEVEKLMTQLQFKDRELDNFRDRCRTLENQAASTSSISPVRNSQRLSPVIKRPRLEDKSHTGQSAFPTSQSFMAEDGFSTSRGVAKKRVETKSIGTMAETQEKPIQQEGMPRKFGLRSRCAKGNITGVDLLADLLDADLSTEKSCDERGIVGLLQKQTSVIDLHSLQFDRDSSNLLSPVHNKRVQELKRQHSLVLSPEKSMKKTIVSPDSYFSAIHGMKCLLRNQKTYQSRTETNVPLSETTLNGAILLLPLIDDYLTQYLDMLTTNIEGRVGQSPRNSSSLSSSSKSSCDSSIESLTASLDMLLKDSANFANNLESLTLVTLQVLHKLVSHSSVIRNILLSMDGCTSLLEERESTDEGEKEMETDRSSPESSSSLDSDWSITSQKFADLNILRKILKVGDCGHKGKWFNTNVIQKCFDILVVLSKTATEEQILCLRPEITGRLLVNALDCRTDKQVVVSALNFLSTLAQYNQTVSGLCVCTDGCILLTMYQACTDLVDTESDERMLVIGNLALDIFMSVQNSHKGGIVLLLESQCNCSVKIVPTVVILIHKILKIYESSPKPEILEILVKGVQLLHAMSQRHYEFAEKHYLAEQQYVKVVCGLTKLFRELPDYEQELNAVIELWDFNQDDPEMPEDCEEDSHPMEDD